ncbi:hypothetical protein F511_38797 [Dorcoceras hygrometricum]|uniref:Uncharacterized protein n=1 Tax=Dorcoceras hygrometricum TaxID=472368 RepID=A0A2Z7BQQ2_9LAMI|nr:hypothetical protein F511_38797 [Dorcoceras hygrometricum]
MKCMRAVKESVIYALGGKSGEPLYHAQPISRWKSSVRDIQKLRRTEELSGSPSRKFMNTANPSCSSYTSIYNSILVSIERAKQDEPSATSLALNNDGNRRQSN